jgi:exosortase/archaeosortase family protein
MVRAGGLRWGAAVGLTSLLWMTVPLPAGYDNLLIQFLQAQSSRAASLVLDCIGILHLPEGNILELSQKRLFVDEACSGVDSLYALMAICLTIVLWLKQPLPVAIVSLSLVPIWASASNVVRLVAIVLGLEWLNIDLSHGTQHTMLGMLVFSGAFMCDYAFIRFAGALFDHWFKHGSTTDIQVNSYVANVQTLHWLGTAMCIISLIAFGGVGVYSTRALSMSTMLRYPHIDKQVAVAVAARQNLPNRLGEWQLDSNQMVERNVQSAFGQYSNLWSYRSADGQATISIDFPFRGFHLLDICYQGAGWRLNRASRQIEMPTMNGGETAYVHLIDMKNDEGKFGYVAYALFQFNGKPIRSLARGARGLERFEQTITEPVSYQIQTVLISNDPIDDGTQQTLHNHLLQAVDRVRESFQTPELSRLD